jgi:hypothetical protein
MTHVKRKPSKALIATIVAGALAITYAAGASTLFVPDEDSASLIEILATSIKQLNTLNAELGTVRQTYSETKKLTGYAEDAANAFAGLAHADVAGTLQLLEDAVPNVRFFDRELHHLNSWTQGRGELNALVRACVRARESQASAMANARQAQETWATNPSVAYPAGANQAATSARVRADQACDTLDAQISGQQLALLIATDFGPPYSPAQQLADQVAADALGDSQALDLRDTTLQDDWKNYEEYCFTAAQGGLANDLDDSAMQKCQAAEILVQLRSARETQILRGETRQLKDIEAYRLLEENGDRKRESDERAKEQQQMVDGASQMVPPAVQVSGPGYDLGSEQ